MFFLIIIYYPSKQINEIMQIVEIVYMFLFSMDYMKA
jgi:hypothetical protein